MRKFTDTYSDLYGDPVSLTPEEKAFFREKVHFILNVLGLDVEIVNRDHEQDLSGKSKEALGCFYTDAPNSPTQDCFITVDNYFIHERYEVECMGGYSIEPQSLTDVICHELAHREKFRHGKGHRKMTEELVAKVKDAEQREREGKSNMSEQKTYTAENMVKNNYILRARVIEGSIPIPKADDPFFKDLAENNFEIIAPYTKDNFRELLAIGKEAYINGDLSKFEILAWAGGANNHDGDRYLWSFRPDLWNFQYTPQDILSDFYNFKPQAMPENYAQIYHRFWEKLPFGFSLSAYKANALVIEDKQTSLQDKILSASQKQEGKGPKSLDERVASLKDAKGYEAFCLDYQRLKNMSGSQSLPGITASTWLEQLSALSEDGLRSYVDRYKAGLLDPTHTHDHFVGRTSPKNKDTAPDR